MIPYGKQDITVEDIEEVVKVLKSDFLTQGPKVKEFEDAFSGYVGSKYALAVSNGTAALHLSTLALKVHPGQKVITTPITFVASANCVLYCGGDVEFADIDRQTLCLDPNKVEDLLRKDPKAYSGIIPVDYSGYPIKMDDFKFLADKYNLWIIEDACHAPGGKFIDSTKQVQKCGNGQFADLSVFSFHPVKHIACGEGGMITTNSLDLYKKLLLLRTHGITKDPALMKSSNEPWSYEMQELGFNYRMPDMLCALGISQLRKAEQALARRQEIATRYNEAFKDLPITLPFVREKDLHAFHLYVIRTRERKELYQALKKDNIFTQIHYIPITHQPYYIQRYGQQEFIEAENFYSECLSLPMYQSLSDEEQSLVINAVRNFFLGKMV